MKASYLVCYDISNPLRLGRVFRYMKGRGVHLQYSVFHCKMTRPELTRMKRDLEDLIQTGEDDIRMYPLPSGMKVFVLGCGDRVPDGVEIFIE